MTLPVPPIVDPDAELPGWLVIHPGTSGVRWRALEPSYQDSGIAIEADDPIELVERCRSFVKVVELAAGRAAGRYAPCRMINGQMILLPRNEVITHERPTVAPLPAPTAAWAPEHTFPDSPPPKEAGAPLASLALELGPPARPNAAYEVAKMKGYTGNPCTTCGGMSMVQNGSCAKCMDCGETSGCS